MTWRSIGLESKLQTALSHCDGSLTVGGGLGDGDGYGEGTNYGYGNGGGSGYGYGYGNGNGIGFGFIEDHSEGYGESS